MSRVSNLVVHPVARKEPCSTDSGPASRAPNGGRALPFTKNVDGRQHVEVPTTQTQRLALLGEVAAGLAHELRQPLMVISLAAQNVTSSLLLDRDMDAAFDGVRQIVAECDRARDIINRVRMFGHIDSAPAMPTHVADAVSGALTLVGSRLRKAKVKVFQALPCDLPQVPLARVPLEQVLTNLILNACDAYAMGHATDRSIRISAHHDGTHVLLRIADLAGGIPKAALPFVFEPFFTTKPAGVGTGLGLSISAGIVNGAGGSLTAQNSDGGAVFDIRLPACPSGIATA